MGRPSRRPRLARPAALALLAFALALSVAAPAQAGWQAPFRVAGPYSLDVQPMQTAFSAGGQAALGYNVFNEDRSLTSQGYAAISGKNGRPGAPVRVPDTQEVLDLAFDGNNLDLLIGTSPALRPCCSSARLVKIAGGKPQRPRLIFPRLTGATVGQLIALPGNRLLSSVATAQAVWTELTGDKGRPAPARLLTPKTAAPQTLGATVLRGNRTVLAWTAAAGPPAPSTVGPAGIMVADGTATSAPRRAHLAVKVGRGHQVDELALGRGSSQGTVAWIESWNDSAGLLHSEPVVADLGGRVHARTFELPGLLASGLSFATDPERRAGAGLEGVRPGGLVPRRDRRQGCRRAVQRSDLAGADRPCCNAGGRRLVEGRRARRLDLRRAGAGGRAGARGAAVRSDPGRVGDDLRDGPDARVRAVGGVGWVV